MSRPTISQRARFTVFTLVQDWIFEENQTLYQQSIENFNERVQLEVAIVERDEELRQQASRIEALEGALRYAEDANFRLASQNAVYMQHVGRCLHCNEPLHMHFPRRVRRRLRFENEPVTQSSDEETTEPEELPSDEDDVEL